MTNCFHRCLQWGSGLFRTGGRPKLTLLGKFSKFWYIFAFYTNNMLSIAFLGIGNGFYVKLCVFQCRGMSLNSIWASRTIDFPQNPALSPDLEVSLPMEIHRESRRNFMTLWRCCKPDCSELNKLIINCVSSFCKHYEDTTNPEYEALTPSGARE